MNNESGKTDLSQFSNAWFNRGAPRWKEALWLAISALFFQHTLAVYSPVKVWLLRRFGASVGANVLIKPRVSIKFPWKLRLGDHVWIGEGVWIDNLAPVHIGHHVCISQGAMLLTGNHNYKKSAFDLVVEPIQLNDGVWIGAKAIVCPGVTIGEHAVLTVGSVAAGDLDPFGIFQGNPAVWVRYRVIQTDK